MFLSIELYFKSYFSYSLIKLRNEKDTNDTEFELLKMYPETRQQSNLLGFHWINSNRPCSFRAGSKIIGLEMLSLIPLVLRHPFVMKYGQQQIK